MLNSDPLTGIADGDPLVKPYSAGSTDIIWEVNGSFSLVNNYTGRSSKTPQTPDSGLYVGRSINASDSYKGNDVRYGEGDYTISTSGNTATITAKVHNHVDNAGINYGIVNGVPIEVKAWARAGKFKSTANQESVNVNLEASAELDDTTSDVNASASAGGFKAIITPKTPSVTLKKSKQETASKTLPELGKPVANLEKFGYSGDWVLLGSGTINPTAGVKDNSTLFKGAVDATANVTYSFSVDPVELKHTPPDVKVQDVFGFKDSNLLPKWNIKNNADTFLNVTIEADGPYNEFLQGKLVDSLNANGGTYYFGLDPGKDITFDTLYAPLANQVKNLKADQLYATNFRITTSGNGIQTATREVNIGRFLSVVDPDGLSNKGNNAYFVKTLADGAGGFVRTKEIDLHLPQNVETNFVGTGQNAAQFGFGGEYNGSGSIAWTFDPDQIPAKYQDPVSSHANVKIHIGGKPLPGEIIAQGTAIKPTTLGVNKAEFEKLLLEGYLKDPSQFASLTGASSGFRRAFADVLPDKTPIRADFATELEFNTALGAFERKRKDTASSVANTLVSAVQNDFKGIDGIAVVDGSGDVNVKWDYGPNHNPGKAVLDRATAYLEKYLQKPDLSEAASEYVFAEGLNRRLGGEVNIGFLNHTDSGKLGFLNFAEFEGDTKLEFATYMSNTVGHELAHTFGVNEAYLKPSLSTFFRGGPREPYDIMQNTSSSNSKINLGFDARHINTLNAAMGIEPNQVGLLTDTIQLYKNNFNLNESASGLI